MVLALPIALLIDARSRQIGVEMAGLAILLIVATVALLFLVSAVGFVQVALTHHEPQSHQHQ
jgi:hypothetical protein